MNKAIYSSKYRLFLISGPSNVFEMLEGIPEPGVNPIQPSARNAGKQNFLNFKIWLKVLQYPVIYSFFYSVSDFFRRWAIFFFYRRCPFWLCWTQFCFFKLIPSQVFVSYQTFNVWWIVLWNLILQNLTLRLVKLSTL